MKKILLKSPPAVLFTSVIFIVIFLTALVFKSSNFREVIKDEAVILKDGIKAYEIDTGFCQLSLKAESTKQGQFDLYILKSSDFGNLRSNIEKNKEYDYSSYVIKSENVSKYESNSINLGVGTYYIIIDNSRYGEAIGWDDISVQISLKERPLT